MLDRALGTVRLRSQLAQDVTQVDSLGGRPITAEDPHARNGQILRDHGGPGQATDHLLGQNRANRAKTHH